MPLPDPSLGIIDGGVHRSCLRIYVEDTDAGGVVYHARYLNYFERSRTQLLASLGFGLHSLMSRPDDSRRIFVVRRADLRYIAPARLDDVLEVQTRVARLGGASIDFDQRLLRGGREIATGLIYVGCIDSAGRPRALPREMKTALQQTING
jgi:tol-pal system-associated acyl-CoA thioesterase